MSALKSLEDSLEDVFVKKSPALPENGKKMIVEWLPWITLILGVLSLWAAYGLWHWAHVANDFINSVNTLSATYGGSAIDVNRMGATVWLSLIVLTIMALIYIAAFSPLKALKKSGWNLLFYAALINIVYGVVVMFTDYGSFGNLVFTIIGSAIGLYFLFQIRGHYKAAKVKSAKKA